MTFGSRGDLRWGKDFPSGRPDWTLRDSQTTKTSPFLLTPPVLCRTTQHSTPGTLASRLRSHESRPFPWETGTSTTTVVVPGVVRQEWCGSTSRRPCRPTPVVSGVTLPPAPTGSHDPDPRVLSDPPGPRTSLRKHGTPTPNYLSTSRVPPRQDRVTGTARWDTLPVPGLN